MRNDKLIMNTVNSVEVDFTYFKYYPRL